MQGMITHVRGKGNALQLLRSSLHKYEAQHDVRPGPDAVATALLALIIPARSI